MLSTAVKDLDGVPIARVTCGARFTLALSACGTRVFGWGDNADGALGESPHAGVREIPVLAEPGKRIVALAAGYAHVVALVE
jgi:alpha-tubulin suppressor-like RCC1 family protein